jgi:hypothetical protein
VLRINVCPVGDRLFGALSKSAPGARARLAPPKGRPCPWLWHDTAETGRSQYIGLRGGTKPVTSVGYFYYSQTTFQFFFKFCTVHFITFINNSNKSTFWQWHNCQNVLLLVIYKYLPKVCFWFLYHALSNKHRVTNTPGGVPLQIAQ